MHELYELKEMLCKELEEYGAKKDLTAGSLEVVDKLAHTIKTKTLIRLLNLMKTRRSIPTPVVLIAAALMMTA